MTNLINKETLAIDMGDSVNKLCNQATQSDLTKELKKLEYPNNDYNMSDFKRWMKENHLIH